MTTTYDRSTPAARNDTDVTAEFAAAVQRWSDRPATICNGTTVSYRELAARVGDTAQGHQARRVAVSVSHTPAVIEHLLGVLAAGAVFCPIDADLPAARQRDLAAAIGLDSGIESHQQGLSGRQALPKSRPTDPAYVLCTSGSTGAPKPVVVSRHALAVTVRALRELFTLTPEDRVLQFASLGWDTCLEEMLPALTAGAAVVFDEAAHSHSFPRFLRMLAQREVSVIDLPTAFWHELVLYLDEERVALPDHLRLVVIGGERVDPTRLRQWRGLDTGRIRLLNTYGCTETTMITHAVQLAGFGTPPWAAAGETDVPIGRALAHVRDHVTAEGELLVSGPGLADGYLGPPDLTAAAFPTHDHGRGPERWFRTGDLVVRGDGGLLYPRGRTDEQVKVLGVRVHPAEVETQLSAHPAVGGAVVIGEHRLGRTALAAYIVPVGAITPGEIKQYLRERLPSQFVPSKVTFVPALSYTASGKVDRVATQRSAAGHDSKGAGR